MAAAAALALAACTTFGSFEQRAVTPIRVDAGHAARLISTYRGEHGLGAVRVDPRLMRVAADYARVMGERDRMRHGLGGSLPGRVTAAGYDWGYVAENLGAGYSGLEETVRGWQGSPGHRRNLLSPQATGIGIAAVSTPPGSDHRTYWALVLAAPKPERVARRVTLGGLGAVLGVGEP